MIQNARQVVSAARVSTKNMKLDFNNLLIVPKETSTINSRSEIHPFTSDGYLPLITAPMDTVVTRENILMYLGNKINLCMPRYETTINGFGFESFSISRLSEMIDAHTIIQEYSYLVDVANGHMDSVLELTKKFKAAYPNTILMVGNVANPETYQILSDAGADYVRIGIGNGAGCLTTEQTGVGYPMASLIKECYDVSLTLTHPAFIVADGGMRSYSDIIKALALGADYVMLGSIFNKALESSGENYIFKKIKISQKTAEILYRNGFTIYKKFRGMSTKEVQRKWGNEITKTSEGVIRFRKVEYTLGQWCENFEHYLRSAMSYSGAQNLKEFIGQAKIIEISDQAYKRFNK